MPGLRAAAALLAVLFVFAPVRASAAQRSARAPRIEAGAAAQGALRSVFFVEGMSCRACTLILDRRLAEMEGVYWARFNYPLRLFTAYHDPAMVSVDAMGDFVNAHEELDAVHMESLPASEAFRPGGEIAAWEGNVFSEAEARDLPAKFKKGLEDYMIDEGMPEWHQVIYEITGEEIRNRILIGLAKEKGFSGSDKTALPFVVAKDFYWPSDRLDPTADESAMAKFVVQEILGGTEGKDAIERFDNWLLAFYRKQDFVFRGENLELKGTGR